VSRTARELVRIDAQLAEMEALCGSALADFAPGVSGWSVGQQVDHLARVGVEIARGLTEVVATGVFPTHATDAPTTMTGMALLRLGWIPRGVAKAPKSVTPDPTPETEEIRGRIDEFRSILARLRGDIAAVDGASARRKHPYFGGLTAASWVRFLWVHQRHHLKIVRDIRREAGRVDATKG
jgi:hypothetical protein